MSYQSNRIVSRSEMDQYVPGYPAQMMTPAFAGLLISDNKNLAKCYVLYQMMVSTKLSSANKMDKELLAKTKKYVWAAIRSTFPPVEKRIEWLAKLGLTDNDEFAKVGAKAFDRIETGGSSRFGASGSAFENFMASRKEETDL